MQQEERQPLRRYPANDTLAAIRAGTAATTTPPAPPTPYLSPTSPLSPPNSVTMAEGRVYAVSRNSRRVYVRG